MVLVIFFILLLMWALGMISSYTFGGGIHLLLVFALIVLVIRLAEGRSVA
ncbi:MAG TPA: lmo0937 family membrane protein [Candidatus Angelobacter sp.]